MNIVNVGFSDIRGGAHIAGYRLHKALIESGLNSIYYVNFKDSGDYTVIGPSSKIQQGKNYLRYALDSYPRFLYKSKTKFSTSVFPTETPQQVARLNPDIVQLHWINGGVLRLEEYKKFNKPIVSTLHDMWAFTGGCHYDDGCGKYENSCGRCPIIGSNRTHDASHKTLQRKIRAWESIDLTIVTPSRWLAKCAKNSALLKEKTIEVIPNPINLKHFKPLNKKFAREILGLPQDKLLILAVALNIHSDSRKGFHYFLHSLRDIGSEDIAKEIELVIVGASRPRSLPLHDYPMHYLGFLHDQISMALVYSAADLFAAPSVQDNLPNTILESLACGTPCVAFEIGGMPDMITHKINGYLAKPFESNDFAEGILWSLNSSHRIHELSSNSRNQAMRDFDSEKIAKRYIDIYNSVL